MDPDTTFVGWQNVQKTIPSGYFCTRKFENIGPKNYYFYWKNHTQQENEFVMMETVEDAPDGWKNHFDNQMLNPENAPSNHIEDGACNEDLGVCSIINEVDYFTFTYVKIHRLSAPVYIGN